MTCEEALLLLSGHLDGQNTGEEEAQLQAHLAACEDCRRLLEDLQALDQGVLSLEEEPPADLCESVMAAIRREAPRQKKKRRWVLPATAAAAVLVLLAGAGALAAPKTQFTENTAPMAVRMMTSDADMAEPETAMANDAAGVSLYSGVEGPTLSAASASTDNQAQALADERSAAVVLLYTSLPELDGLPCETLEDGSLLYTLSTAGEAEILWEAYPDSAELFLPVTETSDISYALLLP